MGQEREDSGRIEIRQIEPRNRLVPLSGKKPQQQNHAVAVAVDGVRTGPPKAGKVVGEVVADHGAEEIRKPGFHLRLSRWRAVARYLFSSFIALSRPPSVSGNMRLLESCCSSWIDGV